MFWGVTIMPGRRYSQTVEKSYHISMATIEIPAEAKSPAKRAQVMLAQNKEKTKYLICNLDSEKQSQVNLDLIFSEGEEVTFYLNGDGVVHLTGYLVDFGEEEDFDMDSCDSDVEELTTSTKRKPETSPSTAEAPKKAKLENKVVVEGAKTKVNGAEKAAEEDDDEEDSDFEGEEDILGMLDDGDDEEADEESDDEEDDDEEAEEEESDDEEEVKIKAAAKPLTNGQPAKAQQPNKEQSSPQQNQPPKQANNQQGNKFGQNKFGGCGNKFGGGNQGKFGGAGNQGKFGGNKFGGNQGKFGGNQGRFGGGNRDSTSPGQGNFQRGGQNQKFGQGGNKFGGNKQGGGGQFGGRKSGGFTPNNQKASNFQRGGGGGHRSFA